MAAAIMIWKSDQGCEGTNWGDPAWTGALSFIYLALIDLISSSMGQQGIMAKRVNTQFIMFSWPLKVVVLIKHSDFFSCIDYSFVWTHGRPWSVSCGKTKAFQRPQVICYFYAIFWRIRRSCHHKSDRGDRGFGSRDRNASTDCSSLIVRPSLNAISIDTHHTLDFRSLPCELLEDTLWSLPQAEIYWQ